MQPRSGPGKNPEPARSNPNQPEAAPKQPEATRTNPGEPRSNPNQPGSAPNQPQTSPNQPEPARTSPTHPRFFAPKVSHRAGSPVENPVLNHRSRWADVPCVNWDSSTEPPPRFDWM